MTIVDTTPTADTPDTAATATATLREAMTAFKAGDQARARMLLQQTLDLDPHNQAAWVWLAAVTSDSVQQREYLEHAGNLDPFSEPGLRARCGERVSSSETGRPPLPGLWYDTS
ncbi:MAG: hypothetical protein ACLFVO_22215 [Chloroflexaceae bacterium]